MWIFTTIGFFSVVADADHPRMLKIRARTRADLEGLRRWHLPDIEIAETHHTDYRYRAFVHRDEWIHAAQSLAAEVDYPNFKHAVARRQGVGRAKLYGEIGLLMYGLQRDEPAR